MRVDLDKVKDKLAVAESRLSDIDHAIQLEMARPFFDRRKPICLFLDIEKRIQSEIVKVLKSIICE